jgi:hypothetical protein
MDIYLVIFKGKLYIKNKEIMRFVNLLIRIWDETYYTSKI